MRAQLRLFPVGASLLPAAALLLALGGSAAAQLANGPWSMYRHDVCHTGQSPSRGPVNSLDVKVWHGFDKLRTSPSLSQDGKTVYFGMGFKFCSIDTSDTSNTQIDNDNCLLLPADVSDSSPAVAANGAIYMGDRDNSLNAYIIDIDPSTNKPKPTLKWRYNNGHEGDIFQHPLIAPAGRPEAGTIYFTNSQSTDGVGIFTALTDSGTSPTVKWKYKIGNYVWQSSPAMDENGIIYFGDANGYVYAFADKGACMDKPSLRLAPPLSSSCNNDQSGPVLLWKKPVGTTPGISASPVIDSNSHTLYIGTLAAVTAPGAPVKNLTALDISNPCSAPCSPPSAKWTFQTIGKVDQTPALARDGTLYVPAFNMGQGRLYAITPGGSQKWVFPSSSASPPYVSVSETSAQPIVAGDGTVYVGLGKNIYALDPATGAQKWTYATTNYIQSSPLIGPVTGGKARLYVPSRDHNLYAISSSASTTLTPTTCWTEGATGPPPANQRPVADAGDPQSVLVNDVVTFDGHFSGDPEGSALAVTWNFGAGQGGFSCPPSTPSSTSTCWRPKHTYTSVGNYIATLTVTDNGQLSDSDTVTITVSPAGSGDNFVDNFDRPNTMESDNLGPKWVEQAGDLRISSHKVKNFVRGDNIAHLPSLTGAAQSAAADFISIDNNTGPRLGLVLRYNPDLRSHYRIYLWTGGTNQLRISKIAPNGGETLLKSIGIPAPAAGTPFRLKASAVASATGTGTTLTATIGAKTISVDDATYASGTIGVLINPGAAVGPHSVDNFCASIGGTCP